MFRFHTKKSNLGKFWRALQWKTLVCFMAIWNILQPFFLFYDGNNFFSHLVYF
jgi:hypothetical protein